MFASMDSKPWIIDTVAAEGSSSIEGVSLSKCGDADVAGDNLPVCNPGLSCTKIPLLM